MKHTIGSALQHGWPNCEWALINSESFDSLVWLSDDIPQPTLSEVLSIIAELDATEAMRLLRIKRNTMLKETDVYALPDFPHSTPEKHTEWLNYRQLLRELPNIVTPQLDINTYELDMNSIEWPERPS